MKPTFHSRAPAVQRQQPDKQDIKTIPAPIGGLNARDGISAMPETDAYVLKNWIPSSLGMKLRNGYMAWSSGIVNPVQTIFQYFPKSSTISTSANYQKYPTTLPGEVFAATKNTIHPINTQGAAGASVFALGNATYSGRLCTNMFVNSASSSFLIANSESDGYITYDGATWLLVTAGAGPTQIAGVNPNNLVFNLPWKKRIWFVERNTSDLWYLATEAVYGTATKFPVGSLLKHGGSISYIANWTIDAGEGVDDFLVIVGENGDVLVYKGVDPAVSMALVGTWFVGPVPKGRRAFTQFGGDLLILSTNGLFPISYITRGGTEFLQASEKEYVSKIQEALQTDTSAAFNQYGWEMLLCPRESLLILSVPNYGAVSNKQYALGTVVYGWCEFTGLPISTMAMISGLMMSADSAGAVNMNFVTTLDQVSITGTGGIGITGQCQPSFSGMNFGMNKHWLMGRVTLLSRNIPAISVQLNTDYQSNGPVSTPSVPPGTIALWDSGKWDIDVWSGELTTYQPWFSVSGQGYAGSLASVVVAEGGTIYARTDYMYEKGGPM